MELKFAREYDSRAWRLHEECNLNEEGLRDAERAVEMAPRWSEGYGSRALLRLITEDFDGAMADLDRGLELTPQHPQFRFNRYILPTRAGRLEEALEDTDTFIRLFPELPRGHEARADVLSLLGRLDEAIDAQERAVDVAGQRNERQRIILASLRVELPGTCDDVARELDEIRAIDPEGLKDEFVNVQLFKLRGLCPEHFDLEGTLASAKRSLDRNPSSEVQQAAYGVALYVAGRYQEALEPLEKSSVKFMGSALPDFPRAMVLWKLERQGEARAVYDQAAAWMKRSGCEGPVLLRLQREAAEPIGLPAPPTGNDRTSDAG